MAEAFLKSRISLKHIPHEGAYGCHTFGSPFVRQQVLYRSIDPSQFADGERGNTMGGSISVNFAVSRDMSHSISMIGGGGGRVGKPQTKPKARGCCQE